MGLEVARRLRAPLDLLVVRKLGTPWFPEVAFGAVASGGVRWIDHQIVARYGLTPDVVARTVARASRELAQREKLYLAGSERQPLTGRTVLLVDDGMATGSTMKAAVRALREHGPELIVVAVPVAPVDTVASLHHLADEIICLATPAHFQAVGEYYADFTQVSDYEVLGMLSEPIQTSRTNAPST